MKKVMWATLVLASISVLSTLPGVAVAQAEPKASTDQGSETRTYAADKAVNPLGKALSCESLKQTIEEKLQSRNVKNFKLEVIDNSADSTDKIVGRCDGGKHKIAYSKN